jgi:hypothetical protein
MSRRLLSEGGRVVAAIGVAAPLVVLAYLMPADHRVAGVGLALTGSAFAVYGSVVAWRLLRRSVVELVDAWREFERVQREIQDGGERP